MQIKSVLTVMNKLMNGWNCLATLIAPVLLENTRWFKYDRD